MAAGPDGLGPLLLKQLIDQVAAPLAIVMKRSLLERVVLED
jgi:hypothetical protein